MPICIIFSPNWLQYVYIEIYALLNTNHTTKTIYLVSDQAGEPSFEFCSYVNDKFNVDIIFLDLEAMYNDTIKTPGTIGRFSKYTLYRLLLPKVICEDRLLYLDADTIVNGDLSELYNMDMEDADIVGVKDIGILDIQLQSIGKKHGDPYINAGVLLMNLKQIRERNLSDIWIKLINTRPTSCYDQDVLNATCKIKLVDNIYNSSISTGFAPLDQIKIAHYAGGIADKPWENTCRNPMKKIWDFWDYRYKNEVTT